jgi:hypothetical protein
MPLRKGLVAVVILIGVSYAGDTWVIRPDGVGPVKIGMSLFQLNAALHERFSLPGNKEDQGCFYVNPKSHPVVAFMIEDGHLVRVDVNKPGIKTVEGVQVGDTEAQAQNIYGSSLKLEPSKYTGDEGGHYLTVQTADKHYGTRFETEKGRITEFYAGTYAAIQYVEGCE